MKILTPHPLLSVRLFRRTLLAAVGLSAMAFPVQAQLISSFESGEGFTSGDYTNGVVMTSGTWSGTWGGSTSGAASMSVTNTQSYPGGTQSLRAVNGASTAYFSTTPNLHYFGATSLSLQTMTLGSTFSANGNIARWEIYYHDSEDLTFSNNSRIAMILQYGAEETDPFRLSIFNTGNGPDSLNPATQNINLAGSAGALDIAQWNEVLISLDLTGPTRTMSVSVGGFDLEDPAILSSAANANTVITGVRFTANTSGSGTAYYDYVTVVPEPSTALLAVCGLGILAVRRKRRVG